MKHCKTYMKRIFTLLLSVALLAAGCLSALGADVSEATVDPARSVSLTLYKYDMTGAEKDGAFDSESYVSTGIYDETVNESLEDYAIQGVVFTYLKVAELVRVSSESGDKVKNAYAFTKSDEKTTEFMRILGLTEKESCDGSDETTLCFESDVLNKALEQALSDNPTAVKTAFEDYMASEGGTDMTETDAQGKSEAEDLAQGLYLLVETQVPENVTDTTDPFLISLPMTNIDGDAWIYDVCVYPKNETGAPDLEKTVREAKEDTGKNQGKDSASDGYAHQASASAGDKAEYQIISTLPVITSKATALSAYTFEDHLSKGIQYDGSKNLTISFYTDKACTEKVTSWDVNSGKFTVEYSDYSKKNGSSMTITMTETGLEEINNSTAVYDSASKYRGYSELTLRITYSATLNEDATVVLGDQANPNEVTLTWKRTNKNYYDRLKDDCHVYSYGIVLTKKFSDDLGDFAKVDFVISNADDNYYVQAALDEETGVYYVNGHTESEAEATVFHPASRGDNEGKIVLRGAEDDSYVITETATDKNYTLLKEDINVTITAVDADEICTVCGKNMKTASAKINGETVAMSADGDSGEALAELTVTNTKGFRLPRTGEKGVMVFVLLSVLMLFGGLYLCVGRRKNS